MMTEPVTLDVSSHVQAQAREWFVRLRSGHATSADVEAFRRWRDAHAEHDRAVRSLGRAWGATGNALADVLAQRPDMLRRWRDEAAAEQQPPNRARRAFIGGAITAAAASIVGLAWYPPLRLWPSIDELASDYRTGIGEQRRLTLSDKVSVEMNTQTRLDILRAGTPGGGIRLLAGETEIVTSTSKMDSALRQAGAGTVFTVQAGRGTLRASEAHFDVRRDGDAVCVTCVSGAVVLDHPQQRVTLAALQQLNYDNRSVQPIVGVDPKVTLAWRRGLLVFEGAPLAQVIDEINRYRPGKVILRNAELGSHRVEAELPIAKLDDAIELLGKSYGARITHLPGHIVLFG